MSSISNINNELTAMQNSTEKTVYANRETGSSELDQDAFLRLMMMQMTNQDPLEPMDNTQMLNQQAQFTQISELQKLNQTLSSGNELMQASSMIGKHVTLNDPDNADMTIEGVVKEAKMNGGEASLVIGGVDRDMPLSNLISVKDVETEN